MSVEDNLYAVSFTQDLDVQIADEFCPVSASELLCEFHGSNSKCVKKGESLAGKDCYSDLDVVTQIYNFVIKNIPMIKRKRRMFRMGTHRIRMRHWIPGKESVLIMRR